MKRLADFIIRRRLLVLMVIALTTGFFGYHLLRIRISTNFNELLPQNHDYIKVHNHFRQTFGGANFLVIMLSVTRGDIFNTATLEKIRYITHELEKIPGIDRYKILSIASRKLKNPKITSWGMEAVPLMWLEIPKNEDALRELALVSIYPELVPRGDDGHVHVRRACHRTAGLVRRGGRTNRFAGDDRDMALWHRNALRPDRLDRNTPAPVRDESRRHNCDGLRPLDD